MLLGLVALLTLAVFEGVRALPAAADQLVATDEAAARLEELTDREPSVQDPPAPGAFTGETVLAVEQVRVRFGDGPWVLDGVSLELRPGQRVAVVGRSGIGKTTLTHLLVRFRDPDEGRVTLGGRDLRELAQDDVRRVVALGGQDAHLFATSIRENVRLARPEAEDDEIVSALRRARAWEWVSSLPDGLDTDVGDEGALVSGGERQRIALARAFLSGASLLVLDEPTAHLDDATADALLDDLLDAGDGVGLLVVTHALRGSTASTRSSRWTSPARAARAPSARRACPAAPDSTYERAASSMPTSLPARSERNQRCSSTWWNTSAAGSRPQSSSGTAATVGSNTSSRQRDAATDSGTVGPRLRSTASRKRAMSFSILRAWFSCASSPVSRRSRWRWWPGSTTCGSRRSR